MTKAQVGGYEFNYECTRIRNAATEIRKALTKILEGNAGPQTIAVLIAKSAIELTNIFDALSNLEKIGKDTKKNRTPEERSDRDPMGPAPSS